MKSKIYPTLLSFVLVLATTSIFAQGNNSFGLPNPKQFDRFSFSVVAGAATLQGDIKHTKAANNSLKQFVFNPIYGFQFGYQMTYTLGLRFRGMVTEFKDTPIDSIYIKKFKSSYLVDYNSPVREGALSLVYNFGNITFLKRNQSVHMFLTAGLGIFSHQATVKQLPKGQAIIEDNKVSQFMIPLGVGFKYRLGHADIALGYDFRKTFTDKIEGVSSDNSQNDAYSTYTAALTFTFGKKKKVMEWINPMDVVYQDLNRMDKKVDSVSTDTDGDGVSDMFDKDNNTPKGAKTYSDGTLLDTDNDGIPDFKDMDPFSARGAKVDAEGREIDTDGDGVPDSRDMEPTTEKGALVNFQGVTIVLNNIATSNNTNNTGNGNNNGKTIDSTTTNNNNIEPVNNYSTTNVTGTYFPSIFFDFGSTSVKDMYQERLLIVARALKMNPDLKVTLTGCADNSGTGNFNERLGLKRAEECRKILVEQYGIEENRVLTETKGNRQPLNNNSDFLNRRVDFSISK